MTATSVGNPPGGTGYLGQRCVARIGFGAMQLGRHAPQARDDDGKISVLQHAIDAGVNHIDTAQFYGAGHANELIRAALHPYPEDLTIVTKVGATPDTRVAQGMRLAQRPAELRREVEANLHSLRCETIAVVNLRRLHDPQGLMAIPDNQVVDLDDQLAEMVALRVEGKIAAVGLSGVTRDELVAALPAGIVCVQNAYSVANRADENLLELCNHHNVTWVPFFPLGSANGSASPVLGNPVVAALADELNATPAQIGLAWLLARDPYILLIPGTTSIAHLSENVSAGDLTLTPDQLTALDGVHHGPT